MYLMMQKGNPHVKLFSSLSLIYGVLTLITVKYSLHMSAKTILH